uniref:Uncharacterized protein n=1 Tax=Arundo donax TaxID=35708 RepID=A0A0A9DIJ5_ARUDO
MDSKEVHALHTLGGGYEFIMPYVPYFSESSVFASKRRKYCSLVLVGSFNRNLISKH